jgi:GTP cyclohydrolase IA
MATTERNKTDHDLGIAVHEHLKERGVEHPFAYSNCGSVNAVHPNEQFHTIKEGIQVMMEDFGLDMTNASLKETPSRVASMYRDELFIGLDYANFPKATVQPNDMGADEMVVVRGIPIKTVCEHHLVPFFGTALVSYIPGDKVIGLSKFHRIVDFFCRRPQVQERLTEQLWHAFTFILGTEDVAVIVKAEHLCVKLRGVGVDCSDTMTSKLGPKFRDASVRAELLAMMSLT